MRGKKKCILECLFCDSHLLLALIHTYTHTHTHTTLCRQVDIGITILLNIATTPVYKKVCLFNNQQKLKFFFLHICIQELLVRLTDEADPFFLFTLALDETDFQG